MKDENNHGGGNEMSEVERIKPGTFMNIPENPLKEYPMISADDWKEAKHQIEENKMRLDFYSKTSSSMYDELHKLQSRALAIEGWKDSFTFWLKLIAWGIFIVVSMLLIHSATFVFSNKEIKEQYFNWTSDKFNKEK